MKIPGTIIIALFFCCNFTFAQDTLYIYRSGVVVNKRAVSEIDSITFYKSYSNPLNATFTDLDGNIYHTVKIGDQTWMVENLRTSKYRTGESISKVTNGNDWSGLQFGAWCNYNNEESNDAKYGKLYNWRAVADSRKIAPAGWHVATDAEWSRLTTYLGGESVAGFKLKEAGTNHWYYPNYCATNEKGFTGLPGGLRSYSDGTFRNLGSNGYFWSSTESDSLRAWDRELFYDQQNCFRYYYDSKQYGFSVRCVKDEVSVLPVISTGNITSITNSSALCSGNITSDGGSAVTTRGICWSLTANPTIANTKISVGTGVGSFSTTITGLMSDSTYYIRAYATNSLGTAYGSQLIFKTLNANELTVFDKDGNLYHTIKIGNQTWMVENLKTTRYNDSTSISLTDNSYQWITSTTPGYCWVNSDPSTKSTYGALYNHYAATIGKLAPTGWHVPTHAEIDTLVNYLGGYLIAGSKLKESGNVHWYTENSDATNSSGFTALPAGYRSSASGDYHNSGMWGVFWTATDSTGMGGRLIMGNNSSVCNYSLDNKFEGFSVRCIKNRN